MKTLLGSLTELSKNSVTADCVEKDFGKRWVDLFINLYKRVMMKGQRNLKQWSTVALALYNT